MERREVIETALGDEIEFDSFDGNNIGYEEIGKISDILSQAGITEETKVSDVVDQVARAEAMRRVAENRFPPKPPYKNPQEALIAKYMKETYEKMGITDKETNAGKDKKKPKKAPSSGTRTPPARGMGRTALFIALGIIALLVGFFILRKEKQK